MTTFPTGMSDPERAASKRAPSRRDAVPFGQAAVEQDGLGQGGGDPVGELDGSAVHGSARSSAAPHDSGWFGVLVAADAHPRRPTEIMNRRRRGTRHS
jgi:hypothetical protein